MQKTNKDNTNTGAGKTDKQKGTNKTRKHNKTSNRGNTQNKNRKTQHRKTQKTNHNNTHNSRITKNTPLSGRPAGQPASRFRQGLGLFLFTARASFCFQPGLFFQPLFIFVQPPGLFSNLVGFPAPRVFFSTSRRCLVSAGF